MTYIINNKNCILSSACNLCKCLQHSKKTVMMQIVAVRANTTILLLVQPFSGLFSRTTWVSRYQKDKISPYLNETRDNGVQGCIGISYTTCKPISTLLQTDNHTNTSSVNFTGWMLFVTPNQQCQSIEGTVRANSKYECSSSYCTVTSHH